MQEVLIVGASGGIATLVERRLIDDPSIHLTQRWLVPRSVPRGS